MAKTNQHCQFCKLTALACGRHSLEKDNSPKLSNIDQSIVAVSEFLMFLFFPADKNQIKFVPSSSSSSSVSTSSDIIHFTLPQAAAVDAFPFVTHFTAVNI